MVIPQLFSKLTSIVPSFETSSLTTSSSFHPHPHPSRSSTEGLIKNWSQILIYIAKRCERSRKIRTGKGRERKAATHSVLDIWEISYSHEGGGNWTGEGREEEGAYGPNKLAERVSE